MTVPGKREELRSIIRDLNAGGDVEALKKRFAALAQDVSGAEIGAMEQELLDEGLPEEKIRKLCDIHVQVFEESLEAQPAPTAVPGHPLHTLAEENKALKGVLAEVRAALAGIKPDAGAGIPPADAARLGARSTTCPRSRSTISRRRISSFPASKARASPARPRSCGRSTTTSAPI